MTDYGVETESALRDILAHVERQSDAAQQAVATGTVPKAGMVVPRSDVPLYGVPADTVQVRVVCSGAEGRGGGWGTDASGAARLPMHCAGIDVHAASPALHSCASGLWTGSPRPTRQHAGSWLSRCCWDAERSTMTRRRSHSATCRLHRVRRLHLGPAHPLPPPRVGRRCAATALRITAHQCQVRAVDHRTPTPFTVWEQRVTHALLPLLRAACSVIGAACQSGQSQGA